MKAKGWTVYSSVGAKPYKENEYLKHSNSEFKCIAIKPVYSKYDDDELERAKAMHAAGELKYIESIIEEPLLLNNAETHFRPMISNDVVYYEE
jgi:hypothetical protein